MNEDYRSIWSHLTEVEFSQRYVDVAGVRVRYAQAGPKDAPAVIMLHGTGGHWEAFCANIGPYSKYFNTYAFDMVGAGFSDKPDQDYDIPNLAEFVRKFMVAAGIRKTSLVGLSLGAQISANFAVRYPELIQRVVLISPVGLARFSPVQDGNSQVEMEKRIAIVNDTSWEKTREIFRGIIHEDKNVIPDLIKIRQTIHRQPNAAANMRHVLVIGTPEVYARGALTDDQLRNLEVPILVFASENDIPFFRKAAHIIAELVPNAKLIELKNAAHWAQFEAYEYFNEVTIKFLRGESA